MVDTSKAIIHGDGGSDAHARLTCYRCDHVTYVYSEHYQVSFFEKNLKATNPGSRDDYPVVVQDLPNFCRNCGKQFEVWTIEYVRAWEPTYRKEETDVVSEI